MKWGIIALIIILLAVPSALAVDAELRNLRGTCDSTGNSEIIMVHYGGPIKLTDITTIASFIETETISEIEGTWKIGNQQNQAYIYEDASKATFNTTNSPFKKKGQYLMHFLFYPKQQDYEKTDITILLDCPGVSCSEDNECDADSTCSDNVCAPLRCKGSEFIEFHRCTAKCNDNNPCTIDRYENGKCTYEKNASCCREDNDCDMGLACQIDKCDSGKCVHSPVICESAKDRCVTAQCVEPKGCIYETDAQCLANENEKRDYLIVIGQPKVYKQPFFSSLFGSIANFFRNLF